MRDAVHRGRALPPGPALESFTLREPVRMRCAFPHGDAHHRAGNALHRAHRTGSEPHRMRTIRWGSASHRARLIAPCVPGARQCPADSGPRRVWRAAVGALARRSARGTDPGTEGRPGGRRAGAEEEARQAGAGHQRRVQGARACRHPAPRHAAHRQASSTAPSCPARSTPKAPSRATSRSQPDRKATPPPPGAARRLALRQQRAGSPAALEPVRSAPGLLMSFRIRAPGGRCGGQPSPLQRQTSAWSAHEAVRASAAETTSWRRRWSRSYFRTWRATPAGTFCSWVVILSGCMVS